MSASGDQVWVVFRRRSLLSCCVPFTDGDEVDVKVERRSLLRRRLTSAGHSIRKCWRPFVSCFPKLQVLIVCRKCGNHGLLRRRHLLKELSKASRHSKVYISIRNPGFYQNLAAGQHPKFMVIACSDSRVCPTTILNFRPGEAFVVRNIANMVPPPEQAGYPGTSAALEYAVRVLKVENILVIGHSRCGGIDALMTLKENTKRWRFIDNWVKIGIPARAAVLEATRRNPSLQHKCRTCERTSVNGSLVNLLRFSFVKEAVSSAKLQLHGGYYNLAEGSFEYWKFGADGKSGKVLKF
ncbi:carbonic anhydrase 2 isoform X2 [Selaginella moellendorffii]|uniref:carbonic anhydrase 2 isoform X2 n=1 Tax=Selaginella moellendorffii TaxID=88036 RepID=UPI000D1C431F|nr:carbonic anhydrase 2 isoform X2 [Selaginella moellendorffii]|eukprot:XP_024524433.1 carbonic anhydrase 2 isoform X2 [Selaginella moellendorffii]